MQPPESDSPTVPRRGAAAAPAAKLASGKVCSAQAAVWYRCCRPGSPAATPYGWSAHRLLVTVPRNTVCWLLIAWDVVGSSVAILAGAAGGC